MSRDLYDVAREVTDEVFGEGTYAELNATNPHPGVQRAIANAGGAMTSVRMFTEREVAGLLVHFAGFATEAEASNGIEDWLRDNPQHGTLRAHGASSVEGATLVEIDEGTEVLVPRDVADAIYLVAEHFHVPPKLFMRELRQAEQAQQIARELREDR